MSYQQKRTLVSIIAGVLILVVYCIYVFSRYQAGQIEPNDWKLLATSMLIFIGIAIGAMIIIQIIFHIIYAASIAVKNLNLKDKELEKEINATFKEDEMDKLIELKSNRLGFVITGVGFIASLVSLVLNSPAIVMLNILFLSCFAGGLVEGVVSLFYYHKGIRNG